MRFINLIFCVLISSFSSTLYAQNDTELYHVIMTQGVIFNSSSKSLLNRGATIKSTDNVIFKSSDARAIMLSQTRGRFLMSPNAKATGSELAAVVKEVASPLKSNSSLSTRGFDEAAPIINFEDFFGDSVFAVIGNELPFKVNTSQYPLDKKNQLAIRYEYKGENPEYDGKIVLKTVGFEDNVVKLNKETHFSYKGSPVNVEELDKIELYYLQEMDENNRPKSTEKLASFKIIFVDEAELEAEIKELFSFYESEGEKLGNDEKLPMINSYILDVYGRTDKDLLEDWAEAKGFIHK